jgi:hypothetical protein
MNHGSRVRVEDLRKAINRVLDFVERDLGKETVDLPHNFYWSIQENYLYSMDHPPRELECGSLVDDLEFMIDGIDDPSRALPIVLIHIAPILRCLAFAVPNFLSNTPDTEPQG